MMDSSYWNALAALLFVLGLLFSGWFMLKRHPRLLTPALTELKIVAKINLDHRHQIVLLQHRSKQFLILLGAHHCNIIDQTDNN